MKNKGTIIVTIIAIAVVVAIVIYAQMTVKKDAGSTESSETSQTQSDMHAQSMDTNNQTGTISTTTQSGLGITVLTEGTGVGAQVGDMVSVNYTGMLENGTKFDSNVDPKFGHVEPFEFQLGAGRVIKGWDEGVLGMKKGEKRHLVIPADLAYGAYSPSPLIPANSVLVFDVEVTNISH